MDFEKLSQADLIELENDFSEDSNKESLIIENKEESEGFQQTEKLRDKLYLEDIEKFSPEQKTKKEAELEVLNNHNQVVLGYAENLISQIDLAPEEEVASRLAVILHDSGKLNSTILNHHKAGEERAEEILNRLEDAEFQGIKITPELKIIIKNAIERHMNHPFLVQVMNKGERFPEPKTMVDKITYDADMLANIGFKNIGFRLSNEDFLTEDEIKAHEKNITALEESFNNILEGKLGVRGLQEIMLLAKSKKIAQETIQEVNKIVKYFQDNNLFSEIQNKFIKDQPSLNIKLVNEAIQKAGIELNINSELIKKFLI